MDEKDNLLENALDLIVKEEFQEAKVVLENIISNEPDNVEAYKNLGLVEVNLDNPIKAIEALSKVLEFEKEDAVSLFYLANCYNRIGQKEIAIDYFKKVCNIRPDYLDAYKSLAMIYIEYADSASALELVQKALNNKNLEMDYTIYYIGATASLMQKDYNRAIEYLKEGIKLNPEHFGLKNSLASCYIALKDYEKAIKVLDEVVKSDENNSLAYYNLGTCYQALEDYKKALENYNISYKLEPTVTMLSTLAFCAYKAGEFDFAVTLYQNLVSLYPNSSEYRLSYIETLEALERYKEALDNVNLMLGIDEKNVVLVKRKGALLRKLGFHAESIDTFQSLVKRGKIDVEVYYNLAFDYVEENDFDNAKEMFKKCIMLEPNNPYAHKDLGVLYLKMNLYDWALEEMLEAINLEDDIAEFHYSLGVTYMMLSDMENAKKAFLKADELEKDNPDNLAYLGYVYLLENKKQESLELLNRALKIDPNNFLAKAHIAKLYYSESKYDIAKEFLLDVVCTTKDDETMNMLACCYMETGEEENAAGIFSKLIKNYPNNHVILTNLAKCEIKIGKKNEAMEHLRQALMIFEDYEPALELIKEASI